MDFNSSDYFSYKKNKLQTNPEKEERPLSKFSFLVQLFIATFIIIFIVIVVSIMKFSAKVDIEYPQGEIPSYNSEETESSYDNTDEERGKIDKRLTFIQQEENAPSEAKIIEKETDKNNNSQVIDPVHIENSKKIDKIEKIKAQNTQSENNAAKQQQKETETRLLSKKPEVAQAPLPQKNIIITSKVLVGRFISFEDAQKVQAEIKAKEPSYTPFVRKTGDVFSIQMGSYQDFSVAKNQAQVLKAKGFDVWIYQQ